MRALHDRPKVSDLPPPTADVLIEEAHRRHRRRQFIVAVTVAVFMAGLAIGRVSNSGGSSPPGSSGNPASSNGQPAAVSSGIEQGRTVATGIEKGRAIVPWVVPGYYGPPFGSLAVAANGTLYYADLEYGQIDEMTPTGSRILLSSLAGGSSPNQSIEGLGGLFVTSYGLFFVVEGGIYQATLAGKDIFSLGGHTVEPTDVDVLRDGTIYYTSSNGVYEIGTSGKSIQVAGGGNLGPGQWRNGLPATEAAIQPNGLVGVSATKFYFTTADNGLDIVQNGDMSEYQGDDFNFFNGEMASAHNGTIYAICGWSMCKMTGSVFAPAFRIPTKVKKTFVAPSDLAIAPDGDFYESFTSQSSPGIAGIFEMSSVGKLLRILITRQQ